MSAGLRRAFEALVRHGTLPLLAFGPGALVLAMLGPGAARSAAPTTTVFVASAAIVVTVYVVIATLERVLPHRDAWNHDTGGFRTDLGYLSLGASSLVFAHLGALPDALRLEVWPTRLPAVAQVVLALVVAEFGHYWAHRLGHERPLLWRLHAIHHSARRLYWMNATRFHPLDLVLLGFVQFVPLAILGIPPGIYIAYFVVSACYGQLQHCNIDVDTRHWRWLFATPELHRWHHSRHPSEGDSNYGAILILWDRLFGTLFWPGAPLTEAVGIGDLPRFPEGLVAQLLAPFRWARVVRSSRLDASPSAVDDAH